MSASAVVIGYVGEEALASLGTLAGAIARSIAL
jgi:hypothetical protein